MPVAKAAYRRTARGLFGLKGLSEPGHWEDLATRCIGRCTELAQDTLAGPPGPGTIHYIDQISDEVCKVYDPAELCRNVHSSPEWRAAAATAVMGLGGFVQQLNMHRGLYSRLCQALQACEALPGGGRSHSEMLLVGRGLMRDFERYGVHLSAAQQQQLAEATQTAHTTGMQIGQNLVDPSQLQVLRLSAQEATRIPPHFRPSGLTNSSGAFLDLPLDQGLYHWTLQWQRDEALREKVFRAGAASPAANAPLLEQLAVGRHELAGLMGCASFAHHKLSDGMLAACPEAVQQFLDSLSADLQPLAEAKVAELRACKAKHVSSRQAVLQPWDCHFYAVRLKEEQFGAELASAHHFLSLGTCLAGLQQLLQQLFGLAMQPQDMADGEAWAHGIQKYSFTHQHDGPLGSIYLDLHPRAGTFAVEDIRPQEHWVQFIMLDACSTGLDSTLGKWPHLRPQDAHPGLVAGNPAGPGKFGHAAHFTLRCGCQKPDGSYQQPLVALVCNFGGEGDDLNTPLAHSQVVTLFHEFGHALNSILSRTAFQHFSGTRGPMDVVELPSHFLEMFACDARVLAAFARHSGSGQAVPPRMATGLEAARRLDTVLELHQQVLGSRVDQLLHGPQPLCQSAMAEQVGGIFQEHACLPFLQGSRPYLRSNHVVDYGAQYYSYLYARCLAATAWQQLMAGDPFDPAAGEKVRQDMLQVGQARASEDYVSQLLGPGALQKANGGWMPQTQALVQSISS